jgi:hypothetical protein
MSFADFHLTGGMLFMSILSISFTLIIATTILNIIRLTKSNYNPTKQALVINDIKAIGIFAIVWGIFGQSIGLFYALQAIEAAADISPAIIFGGLKASMITTLYGSFIFLFSWLITIVMTNWSRRIDK